MNDLNGCVELHHLRCVLAIAEHGTFTEAAAALHVSQPALSHAIARLERDLDARVFDRTSAGARLTAAGKALLGPARRAVAEADSGRAAVAAVTGVLTGDLRVVGIRTAVIETGQLVATFHTQHPGVHLVVEDPTGARGVIEHIRAGRCDIGLMRSDDVPPDLPATPAGAQDIVAIFPESLAPTSDTVTSHELGAHPLVAPLPGTAIRIAHDDHFRAAGIQPRIVAECSHLNTLFELVRGGVGAALTSSSLVAATDRTGIAIRPLRPRARTELSVIRRPTASPAATAFCTLLHDQHPSPTRSPSSSESLKGLSDAPAD
jgi:LysR family cyn operon transcriptional activator